MARRHKVKPGDDIPSLSARSKFRSWKSVWEHPDNAELKGLRGDPSMLNPGDRVSLPAPTLKGIDKSSGQPHRFKLRSEKVRICLMMKDREDAPIAFRPYVLSIDGKQIAEASTDSKGKIEHEIAASAKEGGLDLAPDPDLPDLRLKWKLKLGWMNPVEDVWGIQERLRNLGYNCGPVDGINGKLTKGALQMYEKDKGREPRGELTDQIRNELLEQHDKGGA
jgi:hypothetical protein